MRVTVLVDNNAEYHLGAEWGLSYFIEAEGQKILFDLGASDLFMENGVKMGLNLFESQWVVLSHGHWDHSWGLDSFLKRYLAWRIPVAKRPKLVAHPESFLPKYSKEMMEIGVLLSEEVITRNFPCDLRRDPLWLTEKLVYLGEIPRKFSFENQKPLGKTEETPGNLADDYVLDDSALAYKTSQGLVIITGCSHSGICNIVECARAVCNEERVWDIIGGFHLLDLKSDDPQLLMTLEYLRQLKPRQVHPCHCVDLNGKMALAANLEVKEVRVGLQLEV